MNPASRSLVLPGALLALLLACGCESEDCCATPTDLPADAADVVEPDVPGELPGCVDAGDRDPGDPDVAEPDVPAPDADDPDATDPDATDPDAVDATDPGREVRDPVPLTPGACDQPAYEWLPFDQMGQVVAWEEDPLLALDAATIDGLLGDFGYPHLSPVSYGVRVFVYRYTTQDRGVPVEATATLAVPIDPAGRKDFSTVAWLHGTSGFSDECAPSRGLEGKGQGGVVASLGFIAVVPDYIGMTGIGEPDGMFQTYLIGESTAIGSWDAVRAAHELLRTDLAGLVEPDWQVVPWGGSQGGHAALFMGRYAPYYAPEYDVPGVAALVPPADLTAQASTALASLNGRTALLGVFLIQATRWYRDDAALADLLTDDDPLHLVTTLPQYLDTNCGGHNPFKDVSTLDQLFTAQFLQSMAAYGLSGTEPYGCFLRENSLTTTSVARADDTPVLYVLAENDELVDTAAERTSFDTLCAQGQRLQYLECANASHVEGPLWSIVTQRDWIHARFAGEPLDPGVFCVRGEPIACDAKPIED
jgi:hypothetical protein